MVTPHVCHAVGCDKRVPPKLLMCAEHWRRVPKYLQRMVWREYRPGQERDKHPSPRYLVVQAMAVAHVARQEGMFCVRDVMDHVEHSIRNSGIDADVALQLVVEARASRGHASCP